MKHSSVQKFLDQLREQTTLALLQYIESPLILNNKDDGSPVTILDKNISDLIKKEMSLLDLKLNYYSEEDFSIFKKPMLIVDPIDGTRELMDEMPEFAVSVACLMNEKIGHKSNWGWIYNPLTGEESSDKKIIQKRTRGGLISRSEIECRLVPPHFISSLNLEVLGSIAYKLMLLYLNRTDYVISFRTKNIWDIAAGTILCQKRGYSFYSENKKITVLDSVNYRPPLIWCRPTDFERIRKVISSH